MRNIAKNRVVSTLRWLNQPPERFVQQVLELRLLGQNHPPMQLPHEFEMAACDGWVLLARGAGALAVTQCPLNIRDDATGEAVGEIAALEARDARGAWMSGGPVFAPGQGDLWALVVFKRAGEALEEFALRVRKAMMLRRPGA